MMSALRTRLRGGGELGGGASCELNCRETATVVARNDVLEYLLWASISHGYMAVDSSTSKFRFALPSASLRKSSGIMQLAKNVANLSRSWAEGVLVSRSGSSRTK